jgi:hypothetical protein
VQSLGVLPIISEAFVKAAFFIWKVFDTRSSVTESQLTV